MMKSEEQERFRLWVDTNPKIPAGKTYLEVWNEINNSDKSLEEWIK